MSHNAGVRRVHWIALVTLVVGVSDAAAAQAPQSTAIYRVFLRNGDAIPTYGDAARVDDRMVFNLAIVGHDGRLTLQLMSLPLTAVDEDRTARYGQAMRADAYAASRGEADYAAMLASFSRDLAALAALEDRAAQIARAETVRRGLSSWPAAHFNYRAADVRGLLSLLDAALTGTSPAAGPASVAIDLSYDSGATVLPPPGEDESIEAALAAASVADVGEERIAVLRAASLVASSALLKRRIATQLERERDAERRYAALAEEFRQRAESARRGGNIRAVLQLLAELPARDDALGRRRPREIAILADDLDRALSAARTRREALNHFYAVAPSLAAYERRIRPVFSGLSSLEPLLARLRRLERLPYAQLLAAEQRLQRWRDLADSVAAPNDLAGIQATVISALRMAQEACMRRRLADVTGREAPSREASSAAAGALLLVDRAQADLRAALLPPHD